MSVRTTNSSPVLAYLEGVDHYVVSTTISETDWPGTTVLGADVYERLGELKGQAGADILVLGSPTLVRGLLGHCTTPSSVALQLRYVPSGSAQP